MTFWARGQKGGERVEFFCFGVGRDLSTGVRVDKHPDSCPKVSTGFVTLSSDWKQYRIDLVGKKPSYVLGGFGWAASAVRNHDDVTFYLDDIRYDKPQMEELRFMVSYETADPSNDFDMVMRNVAFSYDNAVALLAFLACGDQKHAKLLADAFLYAQNHDRQYSDGRIRNAYQGGDLALPPGWNPNGRVKAARMPGWYDSPKEQWLEDKLQVSSYAGNVAWAMLALLGYYEKIGGDEYLAAAAKMGEWVNDWCRDDRGAGGYNAGFEGTDGTQRECGLLKYKSTEHNIDLYAAFERLYLATGKEVWHERANRAKGFVLSMWDKSDGKFWCGTKDDGVTPNTKVVPVDVQAWALLALREDAKDLTKALDYAESHLKVGTGYDFNQDRDGIWYEGTAQMAAAYLRLGEREKWASLISALRSARLHSGAIPASNIENGMTTGFRTLNGKDWLYYRRAHVGATAWFILAEKGINPFWMRTGSPVSNPAPDSVRGG